MKQGVTPIPIGIFFSVVILGLMLQVIDPVKNHMNELESRKRFEHQFSPTVQPYKGCTVGLTRTYY